MAFDDGEIAQVRAATDIVALISEQVALKKSGRRWSGLCPFHGEKTPSFSVNAEQGVYYCFGCRASGDAIKFVRETQHLDFRDALQFLADKAGIELHDSAAGPERKDRHAFLEVMATAVQWYHDRLLNSDDAGRARQYLRSRGFDGDEVRRFQLGWAPDEWDALVRHLKVPTPILSGSGLGFENSRNRQQDFLRNRIVFPIFDTSGKPIAMGGRILPPQPDEEVRRDARPEPKYKNSPESAIYSKRRTLYAMNFAKDDIIRAGEIIVCEGYTDVIGLFGAGLPRAVATCGTALSEEHFQVMRNFAKRIVLAYDADAAGQNAAASVYQWERKHEVDVAVVQLPPNTDPGQLAQENPDELRRVVADAIPYLQFRLDRVLRGADLSSIEGRARAAELAVPVIAEHPTEIVRDQYLRQVADRCRVDIDHVRPLMLAALRGEARPLQRPAPSEAPNVAEGSRPGRLALALMIHAPESVDGRFESAYFLDSHQRAAFRALDGGDLVADVVDVLEAQDDVYTAQLVRELAVDELPDAILTDREVAEVVAQLIRASAAAALKEVERDLRNGDVTPDSASRVVRDVKQCLSDLSGPNGYEAEQELRRWLVSREETREP